MKGVAYGWDSFGNRFIMENGMIYMNEDFSFFNPPYSKKIVDLEPLNIEINLCPKEECECGAEIAKSTHSSWCPKYE